MLKKLFLSDKFILGLIFINALILFFGGYTTNDFQKSIFIVADNIITTLFIVELIIKLREYGLKDYFKSNWNKLDFLLIILSIPSLLALILSVDILDMSFLLVFRILRVFKAFRFFKFIPNVNNLVKGVQRALKSSLFVIIGFSIYVFIIGILSFYLFQDNPAEYFSSPTVSMYSTFKLFTIEGWFEIPEALAINYSSSATFFTYLYFVFIVITGGIIGLSLVNSIFVDSMVSDNNDNLEEKINTLDHKLNDIIKKLNNHET